MAAALRWRCHTSAKRTQFPMILDRISRLEVRMERSPVHWDTKDNSKAAVLPGLLGGPRKPDRHFPVMTIKITYPMTVKMQHQEEAKTSLDRSRTSPTVKRITFDIRRHRQPHASFQNPFQGGNGSEVELAYKQTSENPTRTQIWETTAHDSQRSPHRHASHDLPQARRGDSERAGGLISEAVAAPT